MSRLQHILANCLHEEVVKCKPSFSQLDFFNKWTSCCMVNPKKRVWMVVWIKSFDSRNPPCTYMVTLKKSPRRGIEPRSPAWQAGILTTILTRMTYIKVLSNFLSLTKLLTFTLDWCREKPQGQDQWEFMLLYLFTRPRHPRMHTRIKQ